MSLKETIEQVCEGLVDVHVGLVRARQQAEILQNHVGDIRADHFEPLFEELITMRHEIERLMKEVER